MPDFSASRTLTQTAITQGAAGSTDLVDAPGADLRVYVTGIYLVLDAAGSVTFKEESTAITGVMPVPTNGVINIQGNGYPILNTPSADSKLVLTTVTGKAFGWFTYFIA